MTTISRKIICGFLVSLASIVGCQPADALAPLAKSRDVGFKALCLLNPADGKALLPGYTVGDFIRKGKTSGRMKAVIESRSGTSNVLRFLLYDQLSSKTTPVSLQFAEAAPGLNCQGKRAAALEAAAFNFQRVNAGNAMVGGVTVMYTVIQEELNDHLSRQSRVETRAPSEPTPSANLPNSVRTRDDVARDACIRQLVERRVNPTPQNVGQLCG